MGLFKWFSRTEKDKILAQDIINMLNFLNEINLCANRRDYNSAISKLYGLTRHLKDWIEDKGLSKGISKKINDDIYEHVLVLQLTLEKRKLWDEDEFLLILKNLNTLRRIL